MKRIISLALVLLMLIAIIPATFVSALPSIDAYSERPLAVTLPAGEIVVGVDIAPGMYYVTGADDGQDGVLEGPALSRYGPGSVSISSRFTQRGIRMQRGDRFILSGISYATFEGQQFWDGQVADELLRPGTWTVGNRIPAGVYTIRGCLTGTGNFIVHTAAGGLRHNLILRATGNVYRNIVLAEGDRVQVAGGLSAVLFYDDTPAPPPPSSLPFTDVRSGDWFYPAVRFIYEQGIMQGTTPTTFAPHATLTRAQVVAVLFRMHHGRLANPNTDSRTHSFTDVPDNWMAPYIAWAYQNNIVAGVGGARFAPDDQMNREQLTAVMYRYARDRGDDLGVPSDVVNTFPNTSPWAEVYMRWAVHHNFFISRWESARGNASRAATAHFVYRFLTM